MRALRGVVCRERSHLQAGGHDLVEGVVARVAVLAGGRFDRPGQHLGHVVLVSIVFEWCRRWCCLPRRARRGAVVRLPGAGDGREGVRAARGAVSSSRNAWTSRARWLMTNSPMGTQKSMRRMQMPIMSSTPRLGVVSGLLSCLGGRGRLRPLSHVAQHQ